MDEKESKFILENPERKKPSEIGEAVDVLLRQRRKSHKRGGYTWLSEKIGTKRIKIDGYRRSFTLSQIHRIYRLPQGIQWRIDLEKIGAIQGVEITRLKCEEDQWILALAVDAKQISAKDCKTTVNLALKKPEAGEKDYSLREALDRVAGFPFEGIPRLVDMSSPEEWIAISKEAWNRKMNWENFCHHLIAQKQSVLSDIEKVAEQISCWSRDFPKSSHEEMEQKLQFLAKIEDELRQLAELRQPAAEEAIQKLEAEEKEKPNVNEDSGENPSVFLEEGNAEKEADVRSVGDAPESPKPSGDNGELPLSGGNDKTKGKRKKKSAKKSGNMKRR